MSIPLRLCSRAPRTEMWVRLIENGCSANVRRGQGAADTVRRGRDHVGPRGRIATRDVLGAGSAPRPCPVGLQRLSARQIPHTTCFPRRTTMAAQYAYVMKNMTKTFPGAQKPVLSNINLQFYQGAKIGIVGPNGAGKSTLMKIMGGIDSEFTSEAWPAGNITVGYLPQEPELNPSKSVLENVKDGAREVADMVDRFNAISAEMGDPKEDTDFDALMTEMGELQEKIDAVDGWTLDN